MYIGRKSRSPELFIWNQKLRNLLVSRLYVKYNWMRFCCEKKWFKLNKLGIIIKLTFITTSYIHIVKTRFLIYAKLILLHSSFLSSWMNLLHILLRQIKQKNVFFSSQLFKHNFIDYFIFYTLFRPKCQFIK